MLTGKHYIVVPSATTTERLALTPVNGMLVYDTTLNAFYKYENGAWSAFGGSSSLLVSEATASNSATIDFTLPSGYKSFEIKVISLIPSTDNVAMWIRVSTDGGATFAAGASDYVYQRNIQNGTTAAPALSSPDTKIVTLGGAIGNGSGRYFNSIIKIFDPSNASVNKNISVDFYAFRSDSVYSIGFVNGVYKFNTAIDAIRILMSSGNIASGTFELWGYK